MRCTEPGCGGTIDDGYCAVCGTAPLTTTPPPRATTPPPRAAGTGRSGRTTAQPRSTGVQSSGTGPQSSGIGAQSLGTGPQASGIGAQSSGTGPQVPGIGAQASGTGPQSQGMGAQSSGIGSQSSGIGAQPSATGLQSLGVGAQTPITSTSPSSAGPSPSGAHLNSWGDNTPLSEPGACAEPDCAGTILDGYCDTCGTAPVVSGGPDGHSVGTATGPLHRPSAATISSSIRTSGRSVRTRSGSARSAARGRLGAGLVDIPPIPRVDPVTAVLQDPQVPETDRFCGRCDKPVGRSRAEIPARTAGFCPHCGTRYSFVPRLRTGDLVGGQYEVAGALAHGGLGWIYLATDTAVNKRWVVLKGLIDTGDADALAAAQAERRFLAEVDHPNIVKIHNFTEHTDADGETAGYIVMAYVGGTSLKQILRAHRAEHQRYLPPAQAIAYVLEMLPALGYLHARGWAYCDFKPDNVMQTEERLELIDLGAVIAMDDRTSPIYGTLGYQAPEIADTGPTVATEVYTAGRTMAVLMMRVPSVDGRLGPLPGPDTEPLLAQHDSLYRFLLRATDPDPLARFAATSEMADQLTGVLREVLATGDGYPRPGLSSQFGPARTVFGIDGATPQPTALIAGLPAPLVDPGDSGAGLLATTDAATPAELEQALTAGVRAVVTGAGESIEIPLRLIRAELEAGNAPAALARLAALDDDLEFDWRPAWYRAQAALLTGDFATATDYFESVYAALPGEPAPKLALAATLELSARAAEDDTAAAEHGPGAAEFDTGADGPRVTGDAQRAPTEHSRSTAPQPTIQLTRALALYELVWRTDRAYLSAAFGAARLRRAEGDRTGAVAVLDQIDRASAMFTEARVSAVETLLAHRDPADLDESLLRHTGDRVDELRLDNRARAARVRMVVLEAALNWIRSGQRPSAPGKLLDVEFTEQGVRRGLERCLRTLARETDDMWTRFVLVDQANTVRPRTTL
ncbi:serine/threonine-protein kinase [Nocardia lasii]|uniref:non-specific serine/threonine protein kinase n=1 Tax=Nocardia lasii TaxID=1616107 RepID=A0ABW1JL93_9NOCA